MTKLEIADQISRQSGFPKKKVLLIINSFLKKVQEGALNGEKIEIRGFGYFYRLEKKPRSIFSPISGKELSIPAKTGISFRSSKVTAKQHYDRGA